VSANELRRANSTRVREKYRGERARREQGAGRNGGTRLDTVSISFSPALYAGCATLFHQSQGDRSTRCKVSVAIAFWSWESISTLKPSNDIGRVLPRCVFPDEMPTLKRDVTAVRDVVR
jgi:hypothetical protein